MALKPKIEDVKEEAEVQEEASTKEVPQVEEVIYPPVKQVVRNISRQNISNPEAGVHTVAEIDQYLSDWYEKGYELFNTHYLGEVPEALMVLYILHRK